MSAPQSFPENSADPRPDHAATGSKLRPGWLLALAVWAIYTFGMAMAWLVTDNDYDDTAEVLRDMWWVLVILIVIMWVLVHFSGLKVQRSARLGWPSLLLIVPVAIALLGAVMAIADEGTDWNLLLVVLFGTLLVGIGEETAFRGLVLNSIATRTSVIWAVVVSSVLFGLMHSVNAMIAPVGSTAGQVVLTALTGLTLGLIYVASKGNLVLVICLHWLYDFSLIAPLTSSSGENLTAGLAAPLFLLANIAALVILFVFYRGRSWPLTEGRTEQGASDAP